MKKTFTIEELSASAWDNAFSHVYNCLKASGFEYSKDNKTIYWRKIEVLAMSLNLKFDVNGDLV